MRALGADCWVFIRGNMRHSKNGSFKYANTRRIGGGGPPPPGRETFSGVPTKRLTYFNKSQIAWALRKKSERKVRLDLRLTRVAT